MSNSLTVSCNDTSGKYIISPQDIDVSNTEEVPAFNKHIQITAQKSKSLAFIGLIHVESGTRSISLPVIQPSIKYERYIEYGCSKPLDIAFD